MKKTILKSTQSVLIISSIHYTRNQKRHSFIFFQKANLAIVGLALLFVINGCKIGDALDRINQTAKDVSLILEDAVTDLSGSAENYEKIMEETIDQIQDQDIKSQLNGILSNAITKISAEVKCGAQFAADYLKAEINIIIAKLTDKPLPVKEPIICTVNPATIDMNLMANSRNSICFSGYFLNDAFSNYNLYLQSTSGSKKKVTGSLSASTDFKLVINLGASGVPISGTSKKLLLEWKGNLISTVEIIQKKREKCELRERSLTGLPKLILYPVHKANPWNNKKGDTEFAGHGPCTEGRISIYTRNNGRELWARGFVQMWECPDDLGYIREDYTYGDVTKDVKIYTADNGWRIKLIKETLVDNFQNIDTDHKAGERISGGGPVASYFIIGDTSGRDLGKSRVEVSFRSIKVTLEEIGDCLPN